MIRCVKITFLSVCVLSVMNVTAASNSTTNHYSKIHADIQVAFKELNVKKTKSLIKTLLPILDSDVEYTKQLIAEEEDEYFLNKLNSNLKRQREIQTELKNFLKLKKSKIFDESDSINMVRELRRLSMKPKER